MKELTKKGVMGCVVVRNEQLLEIVTKLSDSNEREVTFICTENDKEITLKVEEMRIS